MPNSQNRSSDWLPARRAKACVGGHLRPTASADAHLRRRLLVRLSRDFRLGSIHRHHRCRFRRFLYQHAHNADDDSDAAAEANDTSHDDGDEHAQYKTPSVEFCVDLLDLAVASIACCKPIG